jgi:hypothetical protein
MEIIELKIKSYMKYKIYIQNLRNKKIKLPQLIYEESNNKRNFTIWNNFSLKIFKDENMHFISTPEVIFIL